MLLKGVVSMCGLPSCWAAAHFKALLFFSMSMVSLRANTQNPKMISSLNFLLGFPSKVVPFLLSNSITNLDLTRFEIDVLRLDTLLYLGLLSHGTRGFGFVRMEIELVNQ